MSSAIRSHLRALTVAGILMLGLLLLAACGGGAAAGGCTRPHRRQPSRLPPLPNPLHRSPSRLPPQTRPRQLLLRRPPWLPPIRQNPTATATLEPSPTALVVADASNCVTCHTSEEALKKLAKEEAPAEKLSEGEG